MSVMLYKYPGPHKIHGDNFDYIIVDDDNVYDAIKDGWFKTTDEAKIGPVKPKPNKSPVSGRGTRKKTKVK